MQQHTQQYQATITNQIHGTTPGELVISVLQGMEGLLAKAVLLNQDISLFCPITLKFLKEYRTLPAQ